MSLTLTIKGKDLASAVFKKIASGSSGMVRSITGDGNRIKSALESATASLDSDAFAAFGLSNKELTTLATKAEDAAEPIKRLRAAIDDSSEGLSLLGKSGNEARGVLEDIQDPQLRLRASARLSSQALRKQGLATSYVSDRMKVLKAEAILAVGGLDQLRRYGTFIKGTLLAVGGVITGSVIGGLKKFIETDAKAAKANDKLKKSLDEVFFAFGNAIVGGNGATKVFDLVRGAVDKLRVFIDENRVPIRNFFRDAIIVGTHMVEWSAKAVLGIGLVISGVVEGVQAGVNRIVRLGLRVARELNDLALQLPESVQERLGINVKATSARIQELDASMKKLDGEKLFVETKKIAGVVDDVGKAAKKTRGEIEKVFSGDFGASTKRSKKPKAQDKVDDPDKVVKEIDPNKIFSQSLKEGEKLAGERLKKVQEQAALTRSTMESAFALKDLKAQGPEAIQQKMTGLIRESAILQAQMEQVRDVVGESAPEFEALKGQFEQNQQAYESLSGALSTNPLQQFEDGFERATRASKTFWDAFGEGAGNATKQSVGSLFNAIGDGFAALGNGDDTSLIDFTKNLVGQQASIWGDFFIAQGAALLFTSPAQGIGLGLAGVALKGIAGRLGSSSSSSSSRSSSGGSSSVSSSVDRFSTPIQDTTTTEPAPVYLVMDDDRAMRGYFTDQQNDDARRGRTSVRL